MEEILVPVEDACITSVKNWWLIMLCEQVLMRLQASELHNLFCVAALVLLLNTALVCLFVVSIVRMLLSCKLVCAGLV